MANMVLVLPLTLLPLAKNHDITSLKIATKVYSLVWLLPALEF